jgi:hypothetical protein
VIINIKGYEVLIDDDLAPAILAHKWHPSRRKNGVYFATTTFTKNGKSHEVRLHRVIAGVPPGIMIDHKNRNTLDNRRENLRWCTASQNNRNQGDHDRNKTGYKGVTKVRNRYKAKIMLDGKHIHIGYFKTPEEASMAYELTAQELFGEFYRQAGRVV